MIAAARPPQRLRLPRAAAKILGIHQHRQRKGDYRQHRPLHRMTAIDMFPTGMMDTRTHRASAHVHARTSMCTSRALPVVPEWINTQLKASTTHVCTVIATREYPALFVLPV